MPWPAAADSTLTILLARPVLDSMSAIWTRANEHWNAESGEVWLRRLLAAWPKAIWINPVPEPAWGYSRSTAMIAAIFEGRMVPMTLAGLDAGIRELAR